MKTRPKTLKFPALARELKKMAKKILSDPIKRAKIKFLKKILNVK